MPFEYDSSGANDLIKEIRKTLDSSSRKVNKVTRRLAEESLLTGMANEGSQYLRRKPAKRFTPEYIKEEKPYKLKKNKENTEFLFRNYKTIPYTDFPFKTTYRDPKIGTGIHRGASEKFDRFAISRIKILGKGFPAGRLGTPYQGLGWEPMGTHPKSSRGKYVGFIRTGYPQRKKQNWPAKPDTGVTIYSKGGATAQFAIYYELIRRRKHKKQIVKYVLNSMKKHSEQVIIKEFRKNALFK